MSQCKSVENDSQDGKEEKKYRWYTKFSLFFLAFLNFTFFFYYCKILESFTSFERKQSVMLILKKRKLLGEVLCLNPKTTRGPLMVFKSSIIGGYRSPLNCKCQPTGGTQR